jgi:hypothetical protein
MKTDTYLLVLRDGRRFEGIPLDEVRRILIDDCHYSFAYVKDLVGKATGRNYAPVEIEWVPGRNRNWIVDGVRVGYKCALFALEWKGHTREEAECLMRAARLLFDTKTALQELATNDNQESLILSHFAEGFQALARKS